jgi:hypothetical protein
MSGAGPTASECKQKRTAGIHSSAMVRLSHGFLRFLASTTNATTRTTAAQKIIVTVLGGSKVSDQIQSVWVWAFVLMSPNTLLRHAGPQTFVLEQRGEAGVAWSRVVGFPASASVTPHY